MVLVHAMSSLRRYWVVLLLPLMAACRATMDEHATASVLGADASRALPEAENKHHAGTSTVVPAEEQATIAGVRLALRGCQLTIRGSADTQVLAIDLPEPCKLGRRPDGSVQVVETKQGATALVISSRASAESDGDCDTRKRALVVNQERVRISAKQKLSAGCGTTGPFDEPLFIVLAASVDDGGS